MHLNITTNDNATEQTSTDTTDKITTHKSITLTPEEAEGELVELEHSSSLGTRVYRILSVDPENEITRLKDLATNTERTINNDSFPPHWNHLRTPRPGTRITVHWKEHLNGNGDWVRTTPKRLRNDVERYHGRYTGHERTRCVEHTTVYTPPGVTEHEVYAAHDGELIVNHRDPETVTGLDRVLSEITVPDTYTSLGHVYINNNNDVVWFDIDNTYTDGVLQTPIELITDINEERTQRDSVSFTPDDEIDRELLALAEDMTDERKTEIDAELQALADDMTDKKKSEIDEELATNIQQSDTESE